MESQPLPDKTKKVNTSPTVRTFVPELWGAADIFAKFYPSTHQFNVHTKKVASGIRNHFYKALILRDLAIKLASNLELDAEELQKKGHTAAINSNEFSAVIEGVFTELYSSVDCTSQIIISIYKKRSRKIPDSIRTLFQRVKDNELGDDFPRPLKDAISSASWYEELRIIRDELTHSDIGSCHLDQKTKTISYLHLGIKSKDAPLNISNVFEKIEIFINGTNHFLGQVFVFLNSELKKTTIDEVCGIFFGRIYLRKLPFDEKIDFNSGMCQSRSWFDATQDYKCPFAPTCGAYNRTASTPN